MSSLTRPRSFLDLSDHSGEELRHILNIAKSLKSRRVKGADSYVCYIPISDAAGGPPPTRRVVLAWRRSFTRYEAIAALRNAIYACELPGVTRLS